MASSNSGQQLCWAQGSSACRRIVHVDIRGYQSLISSPGTYDKGFLRHHLKKAVENESNGGVNSLLFTLFTSSYRVARGEVETLERELQVKSAQAEEASWLMGE